MHSGETQPTEYTVRSVPDDEARLAAWYNKQTDADRDMGLAKRRDYGSADLILMAAGMRILANSPAWDPSEQDAIEMALGFYQLGKIARKFGAWAQGKQPNIDSDVDLGVYAMMARRVREVGSW